LCGPAEVRFAEIRSAEVRSAEVRLAEAENTAGVRGDRAPLVAMARGALVGERSWLHLGLVEVREDLRGQGLGRLVTVALAGWAHERGATRAMLQVDERNQVARALYARMGFVTHHRYVTYRLPPPPPPLASEASHR
ncbi:MAG: GNAT family N-acetyltransferase, partial [Sporichthyaceae bacterium]|nr:GNAT family N-acetyltransferase [Sporichthyaceae bacterium]